MISLKNPGSPFAWPGARSRPWHLLYWSTTQAYTLQYPSRYMFWMNADIEESSVSKQSDVEEIFSILKTRILRYRVVHTTPDIGHSSSSFISGPGCPGQCFDIEYYYRDTKIRYRNMFFDIEDQYRTRYRSTTSELRYRRFMMPISSPLAAYTAGSCLEIRVGPGPRCFYSNHSI